jgi:hypothetical protein
MKEVNDVRMILHRSRPDLRLRRQPISRLQAEQIRHQAWVQASLPRPGV